MILYVALLGETHGSSSSTGCLLERVLVRSKAWVAEGEKANATVLSIRPNLFACGPFAGREAFDGTLQTIWNPSCGSL